MQTVDKQICNECGESVKYGSGRFVNRIVDFGDDPEQRRLGGKPFPEGEYICAECEERIIELAENWNKNGVV